MGGGGGGGWHRALASWNVLQQGPAWASRRRAALSRCRRRPPPQQESPWPCLLSVAYINQLILYTHYYLFCVRPAGPPGPDGAADGPPAEPRCGDVPPAAASAGGGGGEPAALCAVCDVHAACKPMVLAFRAAGVHVTAQRQCRPCLATLCSPEGSAFPQAHH